jgi:hypothetical protein
VKEAEAKAIQDASGASSIGDFVDLREDHVLQITKLVNSSLIFRKKNLMVGVVTTSKLQALAWWLRDQFRRGKRDIDASAWNIGKCRECMQLMDLEKETKLQSEVSKNLHPGRFYKVSNGRNGCWVLRTTSLRC